MQKIKSMFLIGLLMVNANLFCDLDKSMNQARTDLYYTTIETIRSAITIGICSYVFDMILSQFQITENMENRGSVATTACVVLYTAFLISAEFHKNSLLKEDNNDQERTHKIMDGDVLELIQDDQINIDSEKKYEHVEDQDAHE